MFSRKKMILFLSSALLVTSYGSIANAEQIGNNENYQPEFRKYCALKT